jgi:glycosyltransferase involved in cell wall biosynthesis
MFKPMPKELARAQLNLPLEKKLVLFAGAARPEKRLDIIGKSISLLKKNDDLIDLVIVSNQPHFMVSTYMNACDVLVLVSTAEGSPNVIKEAMACNLPIVSTDVGDIVDIIGSTKGCYICDGSPEDVAANLTNALRLNKRTDGRRRILSLSLDSSTITERIIKIYEDVSEKRLHRQKEHIAGKPSCISTR